VLLAYVLDIEAWDEVEEKGELSSYSITDHKRNGIIFKCFLPDNVITKMIR
jgi:hypothetical protein